MSFFDLAPASAIPLTARGCSLHAKSLGQPWLNPQENHHPLSLDFRSWTIFPARPVQKMLRSPRQGKPNQFGRRFDRAVDGTRTQTGFAGSWVAGNSTGKQLKYVLWAHFMSRV